MSDDWENEDDWEKEVAPVVPLQTKGQWDDEDVDESNIKQSWDDEDEEEPQPPKKTAPLPPTAKKPATKTKEVSKLKQKIAEREAEEKLRQKAGKDLRGVNGGDFDAYKLETPEERQKRLQLESDLENAKELFGVDDTKDKESSSVLDTLVPKSKEEFDQYISALTERTKLFENHGLYMYFVETLTRKLTSALTVENTRKLSSTLTAISNEKQKAAKDAASKAKKPKKVALKSGKANDLANYDDDGGDFDDFDEQESNSAIQPKLSVDIEHEKGALTVFNPPTIVGPYPWCRPQIIKNLHELELNFDVSMEL
ncbi:hypothetical protein HK098_006682 [Nowakowskiella sp. JEL0407]|nr:hypothetical protein HK098_006682 [Nowakowskiella sp. JEL0407]